MALRPKPARRNTSPVQARPAAPGRPSGCAALGSFGEVPRPRVAVPVSLCPSTPKAVREEPASTATNIRNRIRIVTDTDQSQTCFPSSRSVSQFSTSTADSARPSGAKACFGALQCCPAHPFDRCRYSDRRGRCRGLTAVAHLDCGKRVTPAAKALSPSGVATVCSLSCGHRM